jgi:hypothetical protein
VAVEYTGCFPRTEIVVLLYFGSLGLIVSNDRGGTGRVAERLYSPVRSGRRTEKQFLSFAYGASRSQFDNFQGSPHLRKRRIRTHGVRGLTQYKHPCTSQVFDKCKAVTHCA